MHDPESFQIIIARYTEDVSWIDDALRPHTIIYNKGPPLPLDVAKTFQSVHQLPNVGREYHTYLHHIYTHYDDEKLDHVSLFIQGNITDHIPLTYRYGNESNYLRHLLSQAHRIGLSLNFGPHDVGFLSAKENLKLADAFRDLVDSRMSFGEWFRRYIDRYASNPLKSHNIFWYLGAIFAVDKKHIHNRSRAFYKKLCDMVSKENSYEIGHYLERSWFHIFSHNQ